MKHNILVKAKNFLVFQGDVEAVASQSPKELTRLVEQISGSLELAGEYERAKEDQDRATENATHNFTKRRAIAGEIKQYKEQKGEAERFEALCQERVSLDKLTSLVGLLLTICEGRPYSSPLALQIVPHRGEPREECGGNHNPCSFHRRAA
jgi:chromosome segregation ATPase